MPPLPADSIHARACKLKCEKILTRPLCKKSLSGADGDLLIPAVTKASGTARMGGTACFNLEGI